MNEKNRLPDELNLTRLRFYETDFKALDYSLTERNRRSGTRSTRPTGPAPY